MSGPGPDTPGTGADLLRLAAETLRVHVNEVSQEDRNDWEARVDNWLGGPVGQLVALLSPTVVLALADTMDKIAWMGRLDKDLLSRVGCDELFATARAVLREGES